MQIEISTLESAPSSCQAAVVIDVCRAFTTAAFAFNAGALNVIMTDTVENSLELKAAYSGSLVMGEVGGARVPSFDLWNSPTEMAKLDLSGRTIIQRTSSGTQGMMMYSHKQPLLAGSFVIADATIAYLTEHAMESLTLVVTGARNGMGGVEDFALAEYLEARLNGKLVEAKPFLDRASTWVGSAQSDDTETNQILASDLALCLDIDRFDFALLAQTINGQLQLKPVYPDGSPANLR